MTRLTPNQLALLHECVYLHARQGLSLQIGTPDHTSVASAEHVDARALVRAGLAEWHPKPRPFSQAMIRRAGTAQSPIQAWVAYQVRIVPTAKGRDHIAAHLKRVQASEKAASRRKRAGRE